MQANITDIQECKYLYLHSINEPDDGGLRLLVHEARVGGSPSAERIAEETLPALKAMLSTGKVIEHSSGCKIFEITWDRYIAYAVENESYALPEPKESVGNGRLFIEYSSSVYLEYLSKVSFASTDYPGPFKHWAVCCLDHIVNVASESEPEITVTIAT